MGKVERPTKLWKDDEIFCVALWAQNLRGAVAALLLVNPSLQAHLMNPPVRSTTTTRPHPQSVAVVLFRRKANPA